MRRVFLYELRRLLYNQFFIGLLAINAVFAWYVLTSDTVAGVAYTAPFSPWSFGAYLASVMPMSSLTLLFLLTFFHSKKERQVAALTSATPVDAVRYALIRNAAVALGFALLCALVIVMGLCFYDLYFDYRNHQAFIAPAAATILPCFVFLLGLGHLAGRAHPGYLYALMLACLAMTFVRLPGAFDFFGGGYYEQYPLSLPPGPDGEPAFALSAAFLAARACYLAAGGLLFAASLGLVKPRRR